MKLALYARVSTQRQEEEHTIESQISANETWIKDNGHILIEKYIDDGYSGTMLARPALDKLRDDAVKGLFEGVIIHSPDRLARSYVWQEVVIEELKSRGVNVIFLNRPIAETAEDKLLLGVQGLFGEYERAKFMERTRRGKLHRAKSGHIIGNIAPYGYRCIKKGESNTGYAYYVTDEEEARVVRHIFKLFVEKRMTIYSVVLELNRVNIQPRKGGKWAKSSVGRILGNSTYTGVTYYNKFLATQPKNSENNGYHRRKNTSVRLKPKEEWIAITGVPVIIDEATFQKAQDLRKLNIQYSKRNTKLQYLLTGLIKCGRDNRAYYGVPQHGRPYYRCSGKNKLINLNTCKSRSISASIIDPFVWFMVKNLLSDPKIILNQIKRKQSEYNDRSVSFESKKEKIESELAKLKLEETRVLSAFSSGVISLEQLKAQNDRIKQKRDIIIDTQNQLQQTLRNTKLDGVTTKSVQSFINKIKTGIDGFEFEKKRKLLRMILKEIILNNGQIIVRGYIPVDQKYLLCPQPQHIMASGCSDDDGPFCLFLSGYFR